MEKKIFFILFLISLFLLPQGYLYPDSLEDQLDEVKKEKEETQQQIKEIKEEEEEYIDQLNEVEGRMLYILGELEEYRRQLGEIRIEINRTNLELELKEKELKRTEENLQHKIHVLNERVKNIYKNRNINFLEVILNSENFIDFIARFKLMLRIAEQDVKIIREIKAHKEEISDIKQNISDLNQEQRKQEAEIERLIENSENKKNQLEQVYQEKLAVLEKTKQDKATLVAMEKQLIAKESELKKKLESYRYGNAPGGKFAWPANGILTSGFGNRPNPVLGVSRMHTGIDIAADEGTPVIAAEAGEVIEAVYTEGYGYSLLLYHGGGFATFYAHLSGFAVSPGQTVSRGQVISYVGTTGWTTGPHLHFEVWVNGVVKNPLSYL